MTIRHTLWLAAAALFLSGYWYASLSAQSWGRWNVRCHPDTRVALLHMNQVSSGMQDAPMHLVVADDQVCVFWKQ